jgi:hypothetical protein
MANVLEFALGIETSEFLAKLGISSGRVLSFAGLADTVRHAWDKTWDAINKGAELKGLASATGESVSMLYKFQQGLEAIGGHRYCVQLCMTTHFPFWGRSLLGAEHLRGACVPCDDACDEGMRLIFLWHSI